MKECWKMGSKEPRVQDIQKMVRLLIFHGVYNGFPNYKRN